MKLSKLYDIYRQHPVVTTDSRNCPKDSIFFALRGDNFNGNLFAAKALENGSAFAVVDELVGITPSEQIIQVDDVLTTLQQLANYHRQNLKIPIIAITGTNGKTTTKELVAASLKKKYKVAYTQGNLNNHIGVPLTILSITNAHEIAVVEMGANHPGEIQKLCEIAEPNYGLITNIGKAHLEGFGTFENIVKTKGELFDYIRTHSKDVFVNHDDPNILQQSGELAAIMYGTSSEPSLFVSGTVVEAAPFLTLSWTFCEKTYCVNTHLVGTYNISNVLAAISVGKFFGINAEYINEALENYIPKNNRSQFTQTAKNKLYIDAYNANPTSMHAALTHFSLMPDTPKAVILGEMRELGTVSVEEHRKVIDWVRKQSFEKIFLVGEVFREIVTDLPVFDHVDALVEGLRRNSLEGYSILIKGSHSVHLEKCIDYL